jgi:hypothetical protein
MNALELVARSVTRPLVGRVRSSGLTLDQVLELFASDGALLLPQTLRVDREEIESSFVGYVNGLYQRNGIVFAVLATRYLLFSQIRFQFQQLRNGNPGPLFGTSELGLIESPDEGRSTSDLLARMMLDNDLAGIGWTVRMGDSLRRLRPDWTAAVFGSAREGALPGDPDSKLIGIAYKPGGHGSGEPVMSFMPNQVAWFSTNPDGLRNIVGMPWLAPVLREVTADSQATTHKLAYFRNAATPNLAITLPAGMDVEEAEEWIELMEQEHRGVTNAFRSMYFAGGATAQKIGANLDDIDYRNVTAAGENRIAAAGLIHPVLLGFTDGLQGSSLNQGNFAAAARWTADRLLYGAWGNAAGSLQRLIRLPNGGTRLWYDVRQVPFLRDAIKDRAAVIRSDATAISGLTKDGFEPDSIVDAIMADGDWTRLVHTGLVSVQLLAPGTERPARAAESFTVSVSMLRSMLAEGWTAARPADETTIRASIAAASRVALPSTPYTVRSIETFWPVSGRLAELGTVEAGTELASDHAVVREFPALFAPVGEASSGQIVDRVTVMRKRTELIAAGRPAGIDSLARELNVSRETVRRRLRAGREDQG